MSTSKGEVMIPCSGFNAVRNVFESLTGEMYYKAIANRLVETKTKDELVQYITEIFLGIESLKAETAKRECPFIGEKG